MKRFSLLIMFSCLITAAMANNYYVVNTSASGLGSFRAALDSASSNYADDSIIFNLSPSDTILIPGEVTLLTGNVVFWAPLCQNITISAAPGNYNASIAAGTNSLVLANLNIIHMSEQAVGGQGNITLYNCLFDSDSSIDLALGDNGFPGAVGCDTLWAYNCTFKNNMARSSHNHFLGTYGGAVGANYGYFYNCTFDSNSTDGIGSAIFTGFGAEIFNCTFVNNWVDSVNTNPGEGGVIAGFGASPQFKIANNIFWNNNSTARYQTMNFSGPVVSQGCNILPSNGVDTNFILIPADISGIDPLLDTLGYYDGCMLTFGLKCHSIAIDKGSCRFFTTADEEGRPQQGWRDVGAFEGGINIGPDVIDTISISQTADLTNIFNTTGAIVNYYGHFTDSTSVDTGIYTITAVGVNGCIDTATVTVVYAVDSIDPTVINGIYGVTTNSVMRIYPNPAREYVMIETDKSAMGGSIQISDAMGREIFLQPVISSLTKIETSALTKGVYFVRLNATGWITIRKLVLE